MNPNLENRSLYLYQFSTNEIFKLGTINLFLEDFEKSYQYQIINDLNDCRLQDPTAILLFLVMAIDDFEILKQCKFSNGAIKIIAYFLNLENFSIVNKKDFRLPLKARGFQFIYPDCRINHNQNDLVYSSCAKIIDTVYFRTIRNKFTLDILSEDIEHYTQLDSRSAIAEIIEIGWYLRDMSLNHADSLAGGIAIRFGSGFLTTASQTDKYQITPDRICYVDRYLPQSNIVCMVGIHPPSSESILFHQIFHEQPNINTIVHFHYKPITFDQQFEC